MGTSSWMLVVLGAGAGFASGLLGIGGGVIYVPALMYLAGQPIHLAIGVSLALIVPSSAAGAMKHYASGNVDMATVLLMAPASIIGAVLGAYAGGLLPAGVLKKLFGVCLIIIGINAVFGFTDKVKKAASVGESSVSLQVGSEGDEQTFIE